MKPEKPYNAANLNQVAQREDQSQKERNRYLADLKFLLDTQQGIRVFSKILEEGKVFSTSFTGNSTTFFNEGMRNLALRIFSDVCEAAPHRVSEIILKKGG